MMNSALALTHRTFVNVWNCDENNHMNVRFYYGFFDEAAQFYAASKNSPYQPPQTRQVKYLRELPVAATIVIYSASVDEGKFAGSTFHFLYNETTNALSATAIDMHSPLRGVTDADWEALGAPFIDAKPRSLEISPCIVLEDQRIEKLVAQDHIRMTHRAKINYEMCDANQILRCQDHIGCFSNAAAFAWQFTGLSAQTMIENNIGRVAVEMKLTRISDAQIGSLLEVISFVSKVHAKSFSLCHIARELETKKPLFAGEATALLMNLETRRVIPFDEDILEKLNTACVKN